MWAWAWVGGDVSVTGTSSAMAARGDRSHSLTGSATRIERQVAGMSRHLAGVKMSESDLGQWSKAISDRVTGLPVARLCQIAAVSASSR